MHVILRTFRTVTTQLLARRSQHFHIMKKLILLGLVLGCGGGPMNTVEPAPRPDPARGGIQAEQPAVEHWVNLGVPTEVTPLQRTLQISGHGGKIAQLLIKGVSGEPEIQQIQIEFADKSMKRVDLKKRLLPGDGQVVELRDERPIEKIDVFMDPDSTGQIEIFGA